MDEAPTVTSGRGAAIYAAAGLLPGTRIGHYVLQHELGRGGMGQVFLARDTKLDRKVAIKFVAMNGVAAVERFIAEARVTARCVHPNIVVIHEISEHAGVPYTVLEYVPGDSVAARLRSGPMQPERVAAIMTQVARAMAAAHAHDIVHRDLKPANILLDSDGAVKVVDFGIAKHLSHGELAAAGEGGGGGGDERDLTAADEVVGTLHYLAPEQVRREPLDARVDLWAFGVTMYQMLQGERPYDGVARASVLDQLRDLDAPTPRLDARALDLPPALVEIVHRCLEKRADRRMASANELVAALEALPIAMNSSSLMAAAATSHTGSVRTGDGAEDIASPPTRRHSARRERRWWLGAGAVAIAAIAAGMVIGRCGARGRTPRPPPVDPAATQSRVGALFAEIDRLEARGETAEATRLYSAFIDDEREQAALTLAWLSHADRQRERGLRDAALDSYAAAYARTGDPAAQRRALLALGEIYRERWEWDRLVAAIDVHDGLPAGGGGRAAAGGDARAASLRDQALLAIRSPEAASSSAPATAAVARALLSGRQLAAPATVVLTVDLDGDGTRELLSLENGALVTRSADGARELRRRDADRLDDVRCAGRDPAGGAWAVMSPSSPSSPIGPGWQLVDLTDSTPPLVLDALAGSVHGRCTWADIDGDGRSELYLIGDNRLVQIARGGDGRWGARPHTFASQIGDVLGGDLDGDGRGELVVAVGEWRAYDVRVLRAGADGGLRLDDRERLGVVSSLALLGRDGEGRALIAAIKEDVYPSVRELPVDRPAGAPAGLYVLALGPAGLDVLRRIEVPMPAGVPPQLGALHATDIDGDGVRDLIAATNVRGARGDMLVMHGRDDGGFDVSVVSGVLPLGVTAADADAGDEVLARLDGGDRPWLLGAGDQPLPAHVITRVTDQPPSTAALRDPTIAGAWRRAEELARIGRIEAAVDALRRIATVAPDHTVKVDALRRAGAMLRTRGLPAATIFEALAQLEPPASRARLDALLPAIEERAARLEVTDARRLIDEIEGAVLLTDDERARLRVLRGELAIAPLPLFTGEPLALPWHVGDPTLVHVVPGSQRLAVETLTTTTVASMPLVRSAGLVTLAFDAEIVRTEWAGSVRVRLGPRDRNAPGAVFIEIGGRGGGGIYRRRQLCGLVGVDAVERSTPLNDADGIEAVHVEVAARPAQGRGRCAITVGSETVSRSLAGSADQPAKAGFDPGLDWELSIEGGPDASMTSAVVRFRSITISGFTVATPGASAGSTAEAAIDAAALALAAHRPADARAALATLSPAAAAAWNARRLAVIAAEASGDRAGAVARLSSALGGPLASRPTTDQLAVLVRAGDGQFAPLVRAALGARMAPVLHAAWATVAAHDLDEPRVRTALIRDLSDLPAPSPATAAATLSLGGYVGEILLASGRPDDARRALADALGHLRADAAPETRDRAARIAVLLAVEAATRNDAASARTWGLRALEVSDVPELVADRLLQHPATAALATDPAWTPIVALGRTLHGGTTP